MKQFKIGQTVITPDGPGRLLHYAGYKRNGDGPTTAVVMFGTKGNEYKLNDLSAMTADCPPVGDKPTYVQEAML